MTDNIQTRLQQIATKSGKTITEVQNTFNAALSSLPPNITGDATRQKYALKIVNRDLTGGSKSSASAFEGVIFGAENPKDIMEGLRKSAIAEYQKNPELATSSGNVRVEGDKIVILDNRKTLPNGQPNSKFGSPRPEHLMTRTVHLAVRIPGTSEWSEGKLQLWNDQASLPLPIGKLVSFRANGEKNTTGIFDLRSASVTQFEIKQDLPSDEQVRILDTAFKGRYHELGEAQAYHNSLVGKPGFFDRFIVTEGTVKYIKYSDNPDKNHMIILSDDSLNGEQDAVQVWVPNKLRHQINFGRDSIITLVARTRIGPGWDRETKQKDPTVERLSLEAFSLFGRPGLVTIVDEGGPDLI